MEESIPAHLRPRLHFITPHGWLNDPNGLFRLGDAWHLQYQCLWPRAWGHATSKDLLHWVDRPVTLTPDENGDCWSGGTIFDPTNTSGLFGGPGISNLVSIYASQKSDTGQTISLAFSKDGETWERPPFNPVLKGATAQFRDPKVFWDGDRNRWVMLLTEATHLSFFVSPDLRHWREASQFKSPAVPGADALECPDFFPQAIEEHAGQMKWVLLVSYLSNLNFEKKFGVCAVRYFVGEFDGETFQPDAGLEPALPFGHGPDHYATITWDEFNSRRIGIGWLDHWGYANQSPIQCMTLPRELTLYQDGAKSWHMRQRPARELWDASQKTVEISQQELKSGEGPLSLGEGLCGALRAKLKPVRGSLVEFSFFGNGRCQTIVGYDFDRAVLYFDRRNSGALKIHPDFPLRTEVTFSLDENSILNIEVVFDHSTVEIFADEGAVYLSGLVFPDVGANQISVRAASGNCEIKALQMCWF